MQAEIQLLRFQPRSCTTPQVRESETLGSMGLSYQSPVRKAPYSARLKRCRQVRLGHELSPHMLDQLHRCRHHVCVANEVDLAFVPEVGSSPFVHHRNSRSRNRCDQQVLRGTGRYPSGPMAGETLCLCVLAGPASTISRRSSRHQCERRHIAA